MSYGGVVEHAMIVMGKSMLPTEPDTILNHSEVLETTAIHATSRALPIDKSNSTVAVPVGM